MIPLLNRDVRGSCFACRRSRRRPTQRTLYDQTSWFRSAQFRWSCGWLLHVKACTGDAELRYIRSNLRGRSWKRCGMTQNIKEQPGSCRIFIGPDAMTLGASKENRKPCFGGRGTAPWRRGVGQLVRQNAGAATYASQSKCDVGRRSLTRLSVVRLAGRVVAQSLALAAQGDAITALRKQVTAPYQNDYRYQPRSSTGRTYAPPPPATP
jgi:hypothetical protein